MKKKTLDEFVLEANIIHNKKYTYSNSIYVQNKVKLKITCHKHGDFEQNPNNHLNGAGCPKCAGIKWCSEDFKREAIKIHNDKYCYDDSIYVNKKTKIAIKCYIHDNFYQLPSVHLRGFGCSKCSKNYRYTTDEFIAEASNKHNNKYNYDKVNYTNSNDLISILCYEHGIFIQRAASHMSGSGCPKCAGFNRTAIEFINKSNIIHQNKYKYEKSIYIDYKTKITIECPKHGNFDQLPIKHLYGQGCPKCVVGICKTTQQFIDASMNKHKNKYSYEKSIYINCTTPIIITCSIHGEFEQKPTNHLAGNGCQKCSPFNILKTNEEFIAAAAIKHNNKYSYANCIYIHGRLDVVITCPKHGDFKQVAHNHLQGNGCQKCGNNSYSVISLLWLKIHQISSKYIIQHAENSSEHQVKNSKYKADGYISETNTIYEYNGCFWHGCKKCFKNRDKINSVNYKTMKQLYAHTKKKKSLYC